jgi:hypothetical protein
VEQVVILEVGELVLAKETAQLALGLGQVEAAVAAAVGIILRITPAAFTLKLIRGLTAAAALEYLGKVRMALPAAVVGLAAAVALVTAGIAAAAVAAVPMVAAAVRAAIFTTKKQESNFILRGLAVAPARSA